MTLEDSYLLIFRLKMAYINQQFSFLGSEKQSSYFILFNTWFTIQGFDIFQSSFDNFILLNVNLIMQMSEIHIKDLNFANIECWNCILFKMSKVAENINFEEIYFSNTTFLNAPIFYLDSVFDAFMKVENLSITTSFISLVFKLHEVERFNLLNAFLRDFSAKPIKNSPYSNSESILFLEQFSYAEFSNITLHTYERILPAFILVNPKMNYYGIILVYKCSFIKTTINVNPYNDITQLGTYDGGVLSFNEINEVFINQTLFRNNSILSSSSNAGSAAIYFYSDKRDHLFILECLFFSNQVRKGPFVLSFKGLRFFSSKTLFENTFILDNEKKGLALIKIIASVVYIDNLFAFNNTFIDGLVNIIEAFQKNDVLVKQFSTVNNTSFKRAAGSLLLDGSSKNRKVTLEDSLHINNTAFSQNAGGIQIFHSNKFNYLNLTYNRTRLYYNVASLGTNWWVRFTDKNALIQIENSEFHESYSLKGEKDFSVAQIGGGDKGSLLMIKNCLFNKSVSRVYGFYIKDIFAYLDNVTLIDQSTYLRNASLFKIEGSGMSLTNCILRDGSRNYIFFNIRDGAFFLVRNTVFSNIDFNEYFIRVSSANISIHNSTFVNISANYLSYITASNKYPNAFENCEFRNVFSIIAFCLDCRLELKGNYFKDIASNLFLADNSDFTIFNNNITAINCEKQNTSCILKATSSNITVSQLYLSDSKGSRLNDYFYFRYDNITFSYSKLLNISSSEEYRGLIDVKNSNLNITSTQFYSVRYYCIKAIRTSIYLMDSVFKTEEKPTRDILFFLEMAESLNSTISNNIFQNAIIKKSAIVASLDGGSYFNKILVINNGFENLIALNTYGSCLCFTNINANLRNNSFSNNKALEAGAVYIYCDFVKEENSGSKECSWYLVGNVFRYNDAIGSAGALKWLYIPPLEDYNNIYLKNSAGNDLEFESFPFRVVINKESKPSYNPKKLFRLLNHKSGNNLEDFSLDVIDTYGQSIKSFNKITVDVLRTTQLGENFTCPEDSKIKFNAFDDVISGNRIMKNLYTSNQTPYSYKTPSLFGKSIIFRQEEDSTGSGNAGKALFKSNGTYVLGTPGYTVFLNFSSPDLFLNKKNMSKSIIYSKLVLEKDNQYLNEIICPTSYSFIIPVTIDFCLEGEYFDSEKNLCEKCRFDSFNYFSNQTECKQCPDGLICNGGTAIEVKPGYWRKSNNSDILYECDKDKSNCVGGVNSSCAENYAGNLCYYCVSPDGIPMEKSYTLICRECPPAISLFFVSISFWVLLFLVCWVLTKTYIKNEQNMMKRVIIKCIINYLHTFLMLSNYNLNANSFFQSYLKWLNGISQGVDFWFSMDCITKNITKKEQLFIRYILEISFFHSFLFLFIFARLKFDKESNSVFRKRRKLEEVLLIWYLFYPSIFDYLIRNSMCINIEDDWYLMLSPNEVCSALENRILLISNIFIILWWNLIIPYFLIKAREKQSNKLYVKKKLGSVMRSQKVFVRRSVNFFKKGTTILNNFKKIKMRTEDIKYIINLHYKGQAFTIEFLFYLFKLVVYGINASSINGSMKVLLIWPIVLYYQVLETRFWKYFNFKLQIFGNFLTNFNYLILSYACLWLTIENRFFSDLFFFSSFLFQLLFFKIMVFSYFNISFLSILKWLHDYFLHHGKKKRKKGKEKRNKKKDSKAKMSFM